jgi:hypothetical protein
MKLSERMQMLRAEAFDSTVLRTIKISISYMQMLRAEAVDSIIISKITMDKLILQAKQLEAELDTWRNWRPSNDDLAEMQRQARGRDGTYQKSLAANSVYIGALEVRIRQLEARIAKLKAAQAIPMSKSRTRRLKIQRESDE